MNFFVIQSSFQTNFIQNQEVLLKMGKHKSITLACVVPTDAANYVKRHNHFTEHVIIGTPSTLK